MSAAPAWLPPLVSLNDHGGNWQRYIDAVYAVFYHDFIASQPRYNGLWVRCRRDPICDGKEAGFWHCTSEGRDEVQRTPDLRRCERIGWVRAVIENAADASVDVWPSVRGSETRWVLWFGEEFLVVLAPRPWKAERPRYMQLITAHCTLTEHEKRRLRKDRDEARKRQTPPS